MPCLSLARDTICRLEENTISRSRKRRRHPSRDEVWRRGVRMSGRQTSWATCIWVTHCLTMSYKNVLPDCIAQTSIAQESLSVLRYGSGMKYLNSRPYHIQLITVRSSSVYTRVKKTWGFKRNFIKVFSFLKVFRFLKGFKKFLMLYFVNRFRCSLPPCRQYVFNATAH